MRLIIVATFTSFIASCSVIYNGVVKNNYSSQVAIGSVSGVQGNNKVNTGDTTEVPIFVTEKGTCISVTHKGKTKFYHVPSPPKWAKISGNWNVKFGLSVSPNGAFYVGRNGKAQKLKEVLNCDT